MPWNQDDDEINGIIDSNLKDAPPNPPAVNTAATVRALLKMYWAAISGQVSTAVEYSDLQVENMLATVGHQLTEAENQLLAALLTVEARTAAAEAKADSVYETFSLADRLGTYNATTGAYTVAETNQTGTIVSLPSFPKGKYFDVIVGGTNNIPSNATPWAIGDKIISAGSKWDRIPFGIGDGVISKRKTNFIVLMTGKNLVNTNDPDAGLGKTIALGSGGLTENPDYNTSGFIRVNPGSSYTASIKRTIGWYTASKTFISSDATNLNALNYVLVAPENAAYMRSTCPVARWGVNFQIESGSIPSTYEAYKEFDLLQNVQAEKLTNELIQSLLANFQSSFVTQTSNLANSSVTRQKVSFIKEITSKNLVNPADPGVQSSMTLATDGSTFGNTNNITTGFIPVQAGQKYTISHKRTICWYNSSHVFLAVDETSVGLSNITVTAPIGAAYLRCSLRILNWNSFQVEKGEIATTPVPYDPIVKYSLDGVDASTFSVDGIQAIASIIESILPNSLNAIGVAKNSIAIAPKMYIVRDREIAVYAENVQKHPTTENCEVTITGGSAGARSSKIKPVSTGSSPTPIGSIIAGSVRISDAKKVIVEEKNFTIKVTDPSLTTPKKIMIIGSSTSWRCTFVNRLMATSAAAGIEFLGLRTSSASVPSVLCEGRGGWALSTYSTLNKSIYSPFVQPSGDYMYIGNTDFWIKANAGMSNAVGQGYDYNQFVVANQFNTVTGYPITPVLNTVIYDNLQSKFFRYSGTAWVEIAESTLNFSVNFGKYRQTWGIARPDDIHMMLMSNDFNSVTEETFPTTYATFKTRMDAFIASVKADSPDCRMLLALTYSSGKQGSDGNYTTERRKLGLWLCTQKMIADYGNREPEGIYLIDYHSTVDRVYGFDGADTKPFDTYTGSFRERFIADTTHLGADGFMQMGDLFFGAIQNFR